MLSPEYLAGLFDGEGCVRINRHKPSGKHTSFRYELVVVITNAYLGVLLQCQKQFGGSISQKHGCSLRNCPTYDWTLAAKAGAKFLKAIQAYSIIKHDVIEIALDFVQAKTRVPSWRGHRISSEELALRESYYQAIHRAINK